MIHLASPKNANGNRCGHRGERTHDEIRVSCGMCRSLGLPIEQPPANAARTNTFLPVTDIDGGDNRPGQRLNLHNVIFLQGGSLFWFEEPDVLATMQATEGGQVRRYQGTWENRENTTPQTELEPSSVGSPTLGGPNSGPDHQG